MTEKPTLILLPGLLCDEALWAHQVEHLGDVADVRVADLTREDNMPDLARHVLARAPERFALAGLSMGGYVAQEILRQAPERVERLALVDTNARADTPEQSERRRALMAEAEGGAFKGVTSKLLPNLVHPEHVDVPHIRDTVLSMAERVGKDAFLRQQNAIMHRVAGHDVLGRVTCPALVLCGEDDALTPPRVHEEMVDALGVAPTFVTIAGCGHLAPLEKPDQTTRAMAAWLRGA